MQELNYQHDELANLLARHLCNENRMVWEDIPAGKSGSIRPDVYTIQKSFSNPSPISYEIKVSVSDFRSDVTKGKWKGYLDFSDGVVFAVPKGLITKNDIPNGCGLIIFNGTNWTTVKKPTLHKSNINSELLMKLLIAGNERQTNKQELRVRHLNSYKKENELNKKFGDDFTAKVNFAKRYPVLIEKQKELIRRLSFILGVELDEHYPEWNLRKRVEELERKSDEKLMKSKIAEELKQITRTVDNIIERYTEGNS